MYSDPSVVALVTKAGEGDQKAWNELVERYLPLVWAICARYQLGRYDADDVSQSVFMLLIEQLDKLREPAALPGWLATTTRHECLRVLRIAGRYDLSEREPDDVGGAGIEEEIITAERNAALRAAFAELPPRCRQLLSLLFCERPLSYEEISSMLGVRKGTIGPQRCRCLDLLRRSRHLTPFMDEGIGIPVRSREGEPHE